jgi:electron transport complex protein RnfE
MTIDPLQPNRSQNELARKVKRDRIFLNNPVVMQGLGLAPIVVAATTLKNALMLAVALSLLLTPTRMLAAALSRFSAFRFRGLTYAVSAGIVYIGVLTIMHQLFSSADIALLGLYLPLLIADPIVLKRYERPRREYVKTAFRKGLVTSAGFVLALGLCAGLRELLGSGCLYGHQVLRTAPLPMAQLPSGGFVVLALMIAIWRAIVNIIKRQMGLGAKQEA